MSSDVAMVVLSCDKYSWLWEGWYHYWSRHWKVDIPVYFVTESTQIPEWPGVTPLYVGTGHPWSTCLLKALVRVPHPFIFFSLEDYWPSQDMTSDLFSDLYAKFIEEDLLCLRCAHSCDLYTLEEDGRMSPDSKYLLSCQTSFWDKSYLVSCLDPDEDPWQFEIKGTKRLRKRDLAHRTMLHPLPWYIHACVRGELTEDGKCFTNRITQREQSSRNS